MRLLLSLARAPRLPLKAAVTIALIALASACESEITGAGVGGHTLSIDVKDNFYTITPDTVAVGDSVTWTWRGGEQHSVTFASGTSSSTQSAGMFKRAFASPGSYSYHCVVHGTAMSGVIVAQ
jgi:plastocyanin